jgi:6-pyruvoyltetrahydropterin/6-carboxytetrahydropterin synthase
MHGHSFVAEIWVTGPLDEESGWVLDFGELASSLKPIHERLDHRLLNDVPGLENPTSEELARWLWQRCQKGLPKAVSLARLIIRETCESALSYRE